MREERVVLEDHVDRALVGRIGGHVATTQQDRPAGRELEAADHPQRGRLAAARRTEQREELAGADLERDAVDRPDLAESLLQVEELDLRGRRHRRGRHRDAEASRTLRSSVLASVPVNATCWWARRGTRAGVRWRLRSSLTHLGVRSLRCSGAAFAGAVRRRDSRSSERPEGARVTQAAGVSRSSQSSGRRPSMSTGSTPRCRRGRPSR